MGLFIEGKNMFGGDCSFFWYESGVLCILLDGVMFLIYFYFVYWMKELYLYKDEFLIKFIIFSYIF